MREIEILCELKTDFAAAQNILKAFEFKGAKQTVDYYYFDPLRQNLKLNANNKLMECCRIREKAGKYSVAYKVDKYDGDTWLYSDEHETEFQNLEALQKTFECLGLTPLVTSNNTKYVYQSMLYEIVLEDVKDLGYFLEVEYSGDDEASSATDIKNALREFITKLGLDIGPELNSGKPELLLLKKSSR